MLRDIRFAFRMLLKNPTFTIVAVLTLGLGIGAVTAIFSVVNAVVIRPLPFPEPDRLVRFYTAFPSMKFDKFWVSPPEYFQLQRDARSFESFGAYELASAAIAGRDRPVSSTVSRVTASFFPTLGVAPALGRTFSPAEDAVGDPRFIVLSYGLWQRSFAGDPEIVGKTISVDAIPCVVTGVMPQSFDFPGDGTEAWLPMGLDPTSDRWGNHRLTVIGRLAKGSAMAQAKAELGTLIAAWNKGPQKHVFSADKHPMLMYGLKDEVVGGVKWTLILLQGAVIFVLLIACANISNLLLARAEARSREIAIRNALGADRRRLIAQFLTESVILGVLGGVLGILFAIWGVDATLGLLPEGAPRAGEIQIDLGVLAFAIGSALFTSLLFGLAPIVHTRVMDLHGALKEGQRTAGSPRQRFRRVLVVSEVALAVVLVIGCGLMLRSFARLQQVDVGFRPEGMFTMQLELPEKAYPEDVAVSAFWLRLREQIAAVPGVRSVSMMTGLPPSREVNANDFGIPGRVPGPDDPPFNVDFWQEVGDDYFATMGIRVVAGRVFTPADALGTQRVVVINESLARKFFPGEDAVGKLVQIMPWKKDHPPQTVIGVVADVKQKGLDAPTGTEIYVSLRQSKEVIDETSRFVNIVVRGDLPAKALMPTVRGVITQLDATLPVARVRTMDAVLYDSVAKPRFLTFLLGMFAALALVLAAVGIYGVMSYNVAQRTRELGIRMALGAQAGGVRALVLRDGMFLAGLGIVVGILGAAAVNVGLGKALAGLLFQTRAIDPMTFGGVTLVVLVVAGLACFIPALRATRVDPLIALKQD